MVDNGVSGAANKFLSKSRWRGKLFNKDNDADGPTKEEKEKLKQKLKANEAQDVADFLKPSTDRAQQHRDAAAAAFLSNAKPKIDVARAQRWPGANDVIGSAGFDKSPLPTGGLKKGRKKAVSVSFARTQPEIIGEGGDECEEPSMEVSLRKKSASVSEVDNLAAQQHQDDIAVGLRSLRYSNGLPSPMERPQGENGSLNKEALRRGIVHRTLTSHGELSPPLQQKMEMGRINTHVVPPPAPPPQRLGPLGLGERPRPLQRVQTGFDTSDDGVSRPSLDSTYSYESEMQSPHSLRRPSLAPLEEDDDFAPEPLTRTQTGWSEHPGDVENEVPPRLPELDMEDSPIDLKKGFLESEPGDPNSFSARVIHKMRSEEGQALHEAMKHTKDSDEEGSVDSSLPPRSTPPYKVPSAAVYGHTPPRPLHERALEPSGMADPNDPHRSRARQISPVRNYSPARKPRVAPGAQLVLDTEARPASSSSQYTNPSAISRSIISPSEHYSAASNAYSTSGLYSASNTSLSQPAASAPMHPPAVPSNSSSIQPTPPQFQQPSLSNIASPQSALSNNSSIQPTPPIYERPSYFGPPDPGADAKGMPPPVPPHAMTHDPGIQTPSAFHTSVRPRGESTPQGYTPLGRANTDARVQGDMAYADFAERVINMMGIFRLTAQMEGPTRKHPPMKWLRVAIWWFLRGRVGMESMIRGRPKGELPGQERLTQPHVDLAKTSWILTEVFDDHPELRKYGDGKIEYQARLAREHGDIAMAEVYDVHTAIFSALKLLLGSMKRHHAMPPTQALIQAQDQSIWVSYPAFRPDVKDALNLSWARSAMEKSGQQTVSPEMNPAYCIPVSDTKTDFCYFRMFVNVTVFSDNEYNERTPMPAVLSVMRPKEEISVKLALCSQTELINVFVQNNPKLGPTWKDVKWKVKDRGMAIHLRPGCMLDIEFTEQDFRSLWAVVDHTNRTESTLRAREDEELAYKLVLRDFSYKDPMNPQAFPTERVKGCKVLVFEKSERSQEGTGKRRLHRGFRVVVVTNPKNRTLSCIHHEVGKQEPLNFEFKTDSDGNHPAMLLRFPSAPTHDRKSSTSSAYFVFSDPKERNHFYGILTSAEVADEETVFASVPLKGVSIEVADPSEGEKEKNEVLSRLRWKDVKVINQDPEKVGLEGVAVLMSESLRVVARHGAGSWGDRVNLNPGELLIRLPTDGKSELSMLRTPQQDMSFAIDATNNDRDIPDALAELLRLVTTTSTLRTLSFHSNRDLHAFQTAVTGFNVQFDGIAASFSISRRRMVVPIYKHWSASTVRLQIVQQDNIIQLLAFFEDFSHADAMNFQLKSMDTFEKVDKGGKSYVKLVDAKFALPVEERRGEGKMGKEEGRESGWAKKGGRRRFVCLDLVEYPGEHDDILIGFDDKKVRDLFLEALPAPTDVQRKMTMLRRKIQS